MIIGSELQQPVPSILLGGGLVALILVLPYMIGMMVDRFRSRDPGQGVVWLFSCFFICMALFLFRGFFDLSRYPGLERLFFTGMLYTAIWGQVVYRGVVFYRSLLRGESAMQFASALVTLIVSAIIAIIFGGYCSLIFLFAGFLIAGIHYAISGSVRRRSASTNRKDKVRSLFLNKVGYLPYPNSEPPYSNPVMVDNPELAEKAYTIEFRSADTPEQVLDFYKQCAWREGLRCQTGVLRNEDPVLQPVPAMVADWGTVHVMMVTRDAEDEFLWEVTVLIGTLPAFEEVTQLFSKGELATPEPGRPVLEDTEREEQIEKIPHEEKPEEVQRQPPPPPPPPPKERKKFDWGELEANAGIWGARIGAFIVVIGLGYLLSLGFKALGPHAKTLVVYAACFLMLGLGITFERIEKYSMWAKSMIAGGWAGLYIATFLLHYLPAPLKLIEDPSVDMFLLMGIATGMIIHSLRYKSQTLTTITYFIAFATILISINLAEDTFFSLVATAVLAVSLLFIIRKMQWYWLAIFGTIACYSTYCMWLVPWIPQFRAGIQGSEYWTGLSILALYWLTFTVCAILTKPKTPRREALSLGMVAVNYFLFVLIFRYHVGVEHPELRWYFFAALAGAYAVLSYFAYSWGHIKLYGLSLVLGVLSTTMAIYFGLLGGAWVSIGWLLQAEALYIAGLLGDEKRFRQIAIANFVLVGVWLIAKDFFLTEQISIFGLEIYKRTLIYFTTALVFYINAVSRHALASRIEKKHYYSYLFSYAASILLVIIMARNWYPYDLLKAGVTCAFLGLILMETGIRNRDPHFRIQGLTFALLGITAALVPLSDPTRLYYTENIFYRIGCEAAVVIMVFIAFVRFQRFIISEKETHPIEVAAAFFSQVFTVIAVLLLHREFDISAPVWLILAWMVLGVVLIEMGIAIRMPFLRVHGYLVTGLTLVWALYSFIDEPVWLGSSQSHIFAFGLAVIGFFYLFARIILGAGRAKPEFTESELAEAVEGYGPLLAVFFSFAGTLILILLLRQELVREWPLFVAVAWLITGAVLFEVGVAIKNPFLRIQTYVISIIAFIWVLYAFIEGVGWFAIDEYYRVALGLVIIGFFFLFARVLICARAESSDFTQVERGEIWKGSGPLITGLLSFCGTLVLLLMLRHELIQRYPHFVVVAWAFSGVILLEAGIAVRSQPLRLQSLGIAGLTFIYALWLNLDHGGSIGPFSERMVSLLLVVVALYYIHERLHYGERREKDWQVFPVAKRLLSWLPAILLVVLIQQELEGRWPAWVATAWLVPAIVFCLIGLKRGSFSFLAQSLTLSAVIFLWSLIRTIALPGFEELAKEIDNQRVPAVLPVIIAYYVVFAVLHTRWKHYIKTEREPSIAFIRDAFSWLATILLVALITVEVNAISNASSALTTVFWIGLGIILFEIGSATGNSSFKSQGFLLAVASVCRAVLVNLDAPYGDFLFTTGRVASVAFVAVGLYYFCFRLKRSRAPIAVGISESQLGSLMSYLATGVLALLCYHEFQTKEWIPPAWAGLILFVLFMAFLLKDRHFIYQALLLVLPVTVGILAWDLPARGTPLGRLTIGYAIGLLFAARLLWHVGFYRLREYFAGAGDDSGFLARTSRHFFSLPAAVLLAIYLSLEFAGERAKYLTIAWAIEGLILMVSGFALNDRIMRFFGLGILAICVVRVFYDVAVLDIETPFKVLALIGLGTILIITGWIYSRYREQIIRTLISEED